MNIFSILSNIGDIKKKAPEALAGFLDQLIEENRPQMNKKDGETQILYLMFPIEKEGNNKYYISIVTLDANDTIKRALKTISLEDALTIIFNHTQE